MPNPLIDDRVVGLILDDLLDVGALCALPHFADHDRETFELYLDSARRLSREVLLPSYKPLDEDPPRLVDGHMVSPPQLGGLFRQIVELGATAATRPTEVGGAQLPLCVGALAHAYLMAGNLSAYGYVGLTTGAAHLIEAYGDETLHERFMRPMYEGRWTGTMALTEPHAGSSLGDLTTRATPDEDGTFRIAGSKIFISAGEHDLAENIVHMVLARIEGAPQGTRGISLFAVPAKRPEADGALVDNDVSVAGAIHKIGWRGMPSLALNFGERGDCRGWLVGQPGAGLKAMFQMMNEARIWVGVNASATASVAYHEAVAYARDRPQGRRTTERDPGTAQIPIIEHADVRRMLLRQKAIVDGSLALSGTTAWLADQAEHAEDDDTRHRSKRLLDLLTPVTKTFPSEYGFEANALSLQIHGGYGYSSEYLPESWLRDQKLNSIHEGTTGIQGLDLLGRKAIAGGGEGLRFFIAQVTADAEAARAAGVDDALVDAVVSRLGRLGEVTMHLGAKGMSGDVEGMLLHSHDYLTMTSIVAIAWQHLRLAGAAQARIADGADQGWLKGLLQSARYWIATEMPNVDRLATLCVEGEASYGEMNADWF